nr:hypothetical protein [Tanacetum cinerariifolium]
KSDENVRNRAKRKKSDENVKNGRKRKKSDENVKNKVHFAPNVDLHIHYSIYILRAFFLSSRRAKLGGQKCGDGKYGLYKSKDS